MIRCSLHNHTTYCDGQHTPKEMAAEALRIGCTVFGLSEHSPTPFDPEGGMPPGKVEEYRRDVLMLKESYRGWMEILLGIEQDFFSEPPRRGAYDYIIGSVHFVRKSGQLCCVDLTAEELERSIRENFGGDALALAETYFETMAQLPEVTGCGIVGHFDLLTKFNGEGRFFDTQDRRYRRAALDAMDVLMGKDCLFEVNTGGMAKGIRKEPYPSRMLLKDLARRRARVLLSSDAHRKEDICFAFEQTVQMLSACGFREYWVWQNGSWLSQGL